MESKKPRGRPGHAPDERSRQQVLAMAGYGMTHANIAEVMKIEPKTLAKHYKEELERGLAAAELRITRTLFEQATDPDKPNTAAMIFWLKAKAGWRDRDTATAAPKLSKEEAARQDALEATENGFFSTPMQRVK